MTSGSRFQSFSRSGKCQARTNETVADCPGSRRRCGASVAQADRLSAVGAMGCASGKRPSAENSLIQFWKESNHSAPFQAGRDVSASCVVTSAMEPYRGLSFQYLDAVMSKPTIRRPPIDSSRSVFRFPPKPSCSSPPREALPS